MQADENINRTSSTPEVSVQHGDDSEATLNSPKPKRLKQLRFTNYRRPSKVHALIFMALFGVLGTGLLFTTQAATSPIATKEAETLTLPAGTAIISDSAASGTQAIKFSTNGTATGAVSLPSTGDSFTIKARGDQCKGAPTMIVKLDGVQVGSTTSVSTTAWTEYSFTKSLPAGSHTISLAFTNDNNKGCSRNLYVDKLTFNGTVAPTDTEAPAAPANLKGTANDLTSMSLGWTASTDNIGITNYKVYRNGVVAQDVGAVTTFTDSGLVQNTVYDYKVVAYDAAGNASSFSNIAPVITKEGPPAPPPSYTLDSSFDYPSKSDPENYRQKVDFNVVCKTSSTPDIVAADDPIVWPGQPGKAHMHEFTGNRTINAYSTLASLEPGPTDCRLDRDNASYWMPVLYDENGTMVNSYHQRAYYRAGSLNPVSHTPHGLRIIAGDANATTPQSAGKAGWQCRSVSPDVNTVPKQSTIPTCPSTDLLEASVVFPNCWDGINLDSLDHKSHMIYSKDDGTVDTCSSTHPVLIPQLTVAYRYSPGTTNSNAYLSANNSGLTLHADFFNAWHQPTLDALVDRCINNGVHCGDVYPAHFPGPIPPL